LQRGSVSISFFVCCVSDQTICHNDDDNAAKDDKMTTDGEGSAGSAATGGKIQHNGNASKQLGGVAGLRRPMDSSSSSEDEDAGGPGRKMQKLGTKSGKTPLGKKKASKHVASKVYSKYVF
jgi:hypothetical protein